jgi:hypothetical protein
MQMRANSPLLRFLIAAPPRLSDLFVAQAEKRRQEHERNKGGIRVMLPNLNPSKCSVFIWTTQALFDMIVIGF